MQESTTPWTLQVGTRAYMAPELLEDDDPVSDGAGGHSAAVDVWAVGAVCFRVQTGRSAFESVRQLFDYVRDESLFPARALADISSSEACCRFVRSALAAEPGDRPTMEQAWNHEWLRGYKPILDDGDSVVDYRLVV